MFAPKYYSYVILPQSINLIINDENTLIALESIKSISP